MDTSRVQRNNTHITHYCGDGADDDDDDNNWFICAQRGARFGHGYTCWSSIIIKMGEQIAPNALSMFSNELPPPCFDSMKNTFGQYVRSLLKQPNHGRSALHNSFVSNSFGSILLLNSIEAHGCVVCSRTSKTSIFIETILLVWKRKWVRAKSSSERNKVLFPTLSAVMRPLVRLPLLDFCWAAHHTLSHTKHIMNEIIRKLVNSIKNHRTKSDADQFNVLRCTLLLMNRRNHNRKTCSQCLAELCMCTRIADTMHWTQERFYV